MALLWMEGFEGFSSAPATVTNYLYSKYAHVTASSTTWYTVTGRTGGLALRGATNNGELITERLSTTSNTTIVGCAIKPTAALTTHTFIELFDGETLGINLRLSTTTGEITVYRDTTLLGTTTDAGIAIDNWTFVELKVVVDNTVGTVEIKTGGVSRLSLSDQDTQAGLNAWHNTLGIGTSSLAYIDDVYMCDGTGSFNNDWIGQRKIVALFPNADTATADWTPSTGTDHYATVNEGSAGGASVLADTIDDTDLWDYQDIGDVGVIQGIQLVTHVQETAAKSFDLITPIESDGDVYDDAGVSIRSTSMVALSRIIETDPATDELWTINGLTLAHFGVKLASN